MQTTITKATYALRHDFVDHPRHLGDLGSSVIKKYISELPAKIDSSDFIGFSKGHSEMIPYGMLLYLV